MEVGAVSVGREGEELGSGGRGAVWEQWDIVTTKGGRQTNIRRQ